ncbi:hypothetical protein S1OALGB6SA_1714 [Olavius algarvensis spirochete endosymbiont]|uniref:BMP family ABC transporter substrate-binding protein n=1 Tax=Olavius algarvensis spirochete endosymbiont TaxID=260710 RepID=UPI0009DD9D80|nr:BMP family ABC transporter substrate-binding protein [Olavius algarvensis spirochete endosymbiont]VDB00631.1 hypothetical protein S1OALGB6SA_1714 [Olavius algarvensis spirochete endosymbiont]
MNRFYAIPIFILASVAMFFAGCRGKTEAGTDDDGVLKIVNLINGTRGDKSFFDSSAAGMDLIEAKYDSAVLTKTIEMSYDQPNWEPTLLDIADQDWDIIIVGTWQMTEMLEEVARDNPDKRFIIYDTEVDYSLDLGNVYSILYSQNEASFVAGALATALTKSNLPLTNPDKLIGFLGGMDIPVINDFLVGYVEGARYVDPDIKIAVSYIGSFDDTAKGKEMALAQYSQGVDIGFNVAGQAGLGQLDAAKDMHRYAIGVDSDQAEFFVQTDKATADLIATSVLKHVDKSLLRAIDMHMEGKAPYGSSEILGFDEEGVGIAKNEFYMAIVPEEIRELVDEIEEKIRSGEIEVSSAFGMDSEAINELRYSISP